MIFGLENIFEVFEIVVNGFDGDRKIDDDYVLFLEKIEVVEIV